MLLELRNSGPWFKRRFRYEYPPGRVGYIRTGIHPGDIGDLPRSLPVRGRGVNAHKPTFCFRLSLKLAKFS